MLQFDEDASRRVEAIYTTPDVAAQRERVLGALTLAPNERVLDIGSGPGLLACEIAAAVGPGGAVCGVDVSDSMLAIANARRRQAASAPVEFARAAADALPYADHSFDVAVCTQVYEYVEDVATALAEAHRVLSPGGRLLVLDTDWDSIVWRSDDQALTRRVLAAWEEHLVDPHLPRRLRRMIADAGFELARCEVVPLLNAGYDRNTYSAGLLELVAEFVSGRQDITAEDAAAWASGLVALGDEYFFSLNRYLFAAARSR